MSGNTMPDRALVCVFILSILTYGFGDVFSTYMALKYNINSSEGLPVSASLVSGGLDGYALLLALKIIGLLIFLGIAFLGWKIASKWALLGFVIYGSYLTASNLCVFFFGFPLLPPGDQRSMLGIIWMMVLPFLGVGLAFEAMDTIKILKGEKEGYGFWGQQLKKIKRRMSDRNPDR